MSKPRKSMYSCVQDAIRLRGNACEACGGTQRLSAHHCDEDRRNNTPENIQTLCSPCHISWHKRAVRVGKSPAGRAPKLTKRQLERVARGRHKPERMSITIKYEEDLELGAAMAALPVSGRTHCTRGHPLVEDNVLRPKRGGVVCRECTRRLDREYKQRNREKVLASGAEYRRRKREERRAYRRAEYAKDYRFDSDTLEVEADDDA